MFHCLDKKSGRYLMFGVDAQNTESLYGVVRTVDGCNSLCHVTLPLEDTMHCLKTDQCRISVEEAQSHISMTMLQRRDAAAVASFSIGRVLLGDVALVWEDEVLDERNSDAVLGISVLQQASAQFVITTATVSN